MKNQGNMNPQKKNKKKRMINQMKRRKKIIIQIKRQEELVMEVIKQVIIKDGMLILI